MLKLSTLEFKTCLKILFVFISLFFFHGYGYAKPGNISSLLESLQSSKPDTNRINIYFDIIDTYLYSNPDSAYTYARQGLAYATGINDKRGIGTMLGRMAEVDAQQSRLIKAWEEYTEALDLFKEINYKVGIAAISNGLGILCAKKGNYIKATNYFLGALKIYEGYKNKKAVIGSYIKLGSVSQETNSLDKALEYFTKARLLNDTEPFSEATLSLYNNIGIVYGKMGAYDKSIDILKTGIEKSASTPFLHHRILLLSNAGAIYHLMGKNTEAINCLEEALKIAREKLWSEDEANILVNMSPLYADSNPQLAFSQLQEALAIAQRIGQKRMQVDIYNGLADLYKGQNNFKEANQALEMKYKLRDSIISATKDVEIANLESTYELEKSNNKVDRLTLINNQNTFKTNLIVVVAAAIALILCIVVFYYRKTMVLNRQLMAQKEELKAMNTVTNSLNQQLVVQKEELKELNAVKDKVFSVIGHDLRAPLGNVTAMLRLLEREGKDINDENLGRIAKLKFQTLATLDTLDKLLYWGKANIKGITIQQQGFKAYAIVKSNIDLLADTASRKRVAIINNVAHDVRIYADVSHFDFIIRNLLANALKFTQLSGIIEVNVMRNDLNGLTVFAVHDNGTGISEEDLKRIFNLDNNSKMGTAEEVGTGIGLMLCKEFVQKNGGELWVSSRLAEGSTFYFSLKTDS